MLIRLGVNICLLLLASPAWGQARCEAYKQEVRRNHAIVFGVDYPWHYAVGQLQQESGCRNVISKDGIGSQGLPQVTWAVWRKYLQEQGIESLETIPNQLRAQALINKDAYGQAKPKRLWVAGQIYNGGRLVLKEIERAGYPYWHQAKEQCQRKIITFSNGQKISACEINYDYSQKLFEYGNLYRTGPDSPLYPYW